MVKAELVYTDWEDKEQRLPMLIRDGTAWVQFDDTVGTIARLEVDGVEQPVAWEGRNMYYGTEITVTLGPT